MADGPRRWPLMVVAMVLLIGSAALLPWLLVVRPRRARVDANRRALDASVAAFHGRRWTRPVLRGAPVEGNAFERQARAARPFAVASDDALDEALVEALDAALEGGEPSPAILAAIARHEAALATYRASAQAGWSWGDYPVERGLAAQEIELGPHLRASRLLAIQASRAPADTCVSIATDLIRLGQDRAAGRSLVAVMIHHVTAGYAARALPRCLVAADDATRARAIRELTILVEHPLPTGHALEVEGLGAGAMSLELLRPLASLPHDGPSLEAWWTSADVLEVWETLAGDLDARRAMGERYPEGIDAYEAWERRLAASANPLLAITAPAIGRYLRRDAVTRTRLRMLLAMARLLAGEPASILEEARLQDPLAGAPMTLEARDGARALVAVGEDRTAGTADDLRLRLDPSGFEGDP